MKRKKDFFTLCEELVEKNTNQTDLPQFLDCMLHRIAIEVVKNNYRINVPIEQLFKHLKEEIKLDRQFKKQNLEKLEKIELIKILKSEK